MGSYAGASQTAALERFFSDCVGSLVNEEPARLAEAVNLFVSKNGFRADLAAPAQEASIRDAIEAGAAVDAALAIIGDDTVFMLSRGGGGTCLATMILADGGEEVMGEAVTPALALLAAYAAALLARAQPESTDRSANQSRLTTRLH